MEDSYTHYHGENLSTKATLETTPVEMLAAFRGYFSEVSIIMVVVENL